MLYYVHFRNVNHAARSVLKDALIKKSTPDEPWTSIKEHNINIKESYAYVFHCLLCNTFRSIEFTMAAPKNHGRRCYLRIFQKSVCGEVRNAAAVFHFNNRQPI